MFELLFKYPRAVFSKGTLVLLGAWPWWVLVLLVLAAGAGLAWLIRSRLPQAASHMKNWRAGVIWLLQFALAALFCFCCGSRPSWWRSSGRSRTSSRCWWTIRAACPLRTRGTTREAQAIKALEGGVLDQLQKKFQIRIYRLDRQISRVAKLDDLKTAPPAPATRIGDGLKQLAGEAADLPIGAVVLLSDGADNSGGIDLDTISTFRSRRIPVHTVGFGAEQVAHDVEINDAVVAPRALADSRLAAKVTLHQRGYAGQKAMLTVRDGGKVLAGRQITLAGDGVTQNETLLFNAGDAGAKTLQFSVDPLPGEENRDNNSVARLVNVESAKRRVLYVEGEPRWEYKFIRRAEQDDRLLTIVSMLRTSENKIYRQGIEDPKELADGFPSRAEDLFPYQAIIIGSVEANYFTAAQKELIQQFVDRRGGGLLFLGGRASLGDGGWAASSLADLLPVTLPNKKGTFHRDPATASLTAAGADNIITRLVEDPAANVERWKKLPYLMDYQEAGTPKPGAVVLAEMTAAKQENAAADHGKLWPRAHRRAGHGRHMALADEPAARGSDARGILAATPALAGDGHAGPRGGGGSHPDAAGRRPRAIFRGRARQEFFAGGGRSRRSAHPRAGRLGGANRNDAGPEHAGHISRGVDRGPAGIVSHRSGCHAR